MIGLRSLVCLTASLLGACSSSEPKPTDSQKLERRAGPPVVEAEPKPATAAVREGFGPVIGGSLVALPTVAGRYASELRYSQEQLVTMERTISTRYAGTIELELAADGSARLCHTMVYHSRDKVGGLATDDVKARTTEREDPFTFAMAGRWSVAGDGVAVTIQFDRYAHTTCDVPDDPAQNQIANVVPGGKMRDVVCFSAAANEALPGSALLCALTPGQHPSLLTDAALLLIDSPLAGSWVLSHSSNIESDASPGDGQPYLVLGADPGLRIVSEEARRSGPELRFEATPVAKPEVVQPASP